MIGVDPALVEIPDIEAWAEPRLRILYVRAP
jgi:hypothetical protein